MTEHLPPQPSGDESDRPTPRPFWYHAYENPAGPDYGPDYAYGPGHGPGPGYGAAPSPAPPSVRVRRRRRTGPALAVALVAGAVAASAAVSHEVWPASSTRAASGATQAPSSSGTGSSGLGSNGTGSTGLGSSGLGSSGTGSSGTGSSGLGSSGTGSSGLGDGSSGLGDGSSGLGNGSSGLGDGSSGLGGSGSSSSSGSGSADVSSVATKVDPALVDINTTFQYQGAEGAGTGIVLTSTGEILTNNHVINGATSISVTDVGNGKTYSAHVVGYDASDDVAVLQLVNASGLQTASIGNSDKVAVGESVVAIGNAGGTGGTPNAAGGSVTALNQAITASDELNGTSENLSNLIETDANVQSGDSGGSLVNSSGQVIGMDSAAAQGFSLQSSGSDTNQGYAIPINKAISIAKAMESGKASSTIHVGPTAFLGILVSSPSSGSSSGSPYSGFGDGYGSYGSGSTGSGATGSGATISSVVSGGAAADAGLAQGDVITAIDGQTISSAGTISQIVAHDRPGQSIQITWTDQSGTSHTSSVTLQSGPPA